MILDELVTYLQANGFGTSSVNLFAGRMPEEPHDLIAVAEYMGMGIERTHDVSSYIVQPRVQFLIRSESYQSAAIKARNLFLLMESAINTTISGIKYLRIQPLQVPFFLQRDENDRVIFAFNAQCMKEFS